MANPGAPMDQVEAALQQLREVLAVDGYDLEVEPGPTGLALRVLARPGACEECLVPKQLFMALVTQALDDAGLDYTDIPLELIYPLDSHH